MYDDFKLLCHLNKLLRWLVGRFTNSNSPFEEQGWVTLTCRVQGPERRSAIASGLRVALRSDHLRISCAQVIRGQHVGQQQGGAAQEAPEQRLHRVSRVLCPLLLTSAGIWAPPHLRSSQRNASKCPPNPEVRHDLEATVNDCRTVTTPPPVQCVPSVQFD